MFPYIIAKLNLVFFAAACTPAQVSALNNQTFFFFKPWWFYLPKQLDSLNNCVPTVDFVHNWNQFWLIGFVILDDLLRAAGFVAVISIMVAGVQLVLSEGNPENATKARNRLINSLIGLAIAFSATALVALVGNTINAGTIGNLPNGSATTTTIQNILNVGFAIVGALAFLFIVIAGFRYVISGDNPTKVAEARRQILYAALGLLVIALAGAIVNYIINHLVKG